MQKLDNLKIATKLLRSLVLSPKQDIDVFRKTFTKNFYRKTLPDRVVCSQKDIANVPCDLLEPPLFCQDKIILYVHGGSFVAGDSKCYRSFCASIANLSVCRLVIPNYCLAPENPFPKGMKDIAGVIENLLDSSLTREDTKLIMIADGAGVPVMLPCLIDLEQEQKKHIKGVVLLSPWLDLTLSHLSAKEKKHPTRAPDKVLCIDSITRARSLYTYTSNFQNKSISPLLNKEDAFCGLGDFYIQVGQKELLLDQSYLFKDLLEGAGVSCKVDSFCDMPFCFQLADELLESSFVAIQKIGQFARELC